MSLLDEVSSVNTLRLRVDLSLTKASFLKVTYIPNPRLELCVYDIFAYSSVAEIESNLPSTELSNFSPATEALLFGAVVRYSCGEHSAFATGNESTVASLELTCLKNKTWTPVSALPPCVCEDLTSYHHLSCISLDTFSRHSLFEISQFQPSVHPAVVGWQSRSRRIQCDSYLRKWKGACL